MAIFISSVTPPPDAQQIEGLTWPNPLAVVTREPFAGITDPRLLAAVLLSVMAGLYVVFR